MGSFSLIHWLVVILVLILLFGRGKISDLMGDMAKGINSFKKGLADGDAPPAGYVPPPGYAPPQGYPAAQGYAPARRMRRRTSRRRRRRCRSSRCRRFATTFPGAEARLKGG